MRKRWWAFTRLSVCLLIAAPFQAALRADEPSGGMSDHAHGAGTTEALAPDRLAPSAQYERRLSEPWSTDWPQDPAPAGKRGILTPAIDAARRTNVKAPCPNCGHPHDVAANGQGPPPLGPLYGPDPGEWLFRPLSGGWFMGVMWGDELIRSRVDQHQGFFGGVRLGWDWHEYWGWETRLGFAATDLSGVPPNAGQDADWFLWDVSLLYYPWADERWRPYMLSGMGVADISFNNDLGGTVDETLFAVVIGVGIKYRLGSRVVTRLELLDNIAFGTRRDLTTANNLSLTAGLEYRLGGSPTRYWPWEPSHYFW